MKRILNTKDIIYRRDILFRIECLNNYRYLMRSEKKELELLRSIVNLAGGYENFEEGEPLISKRFFAEYGKNELDYLRIVLNGTTYYMRMVT